MVRYLWAHVIDCLTLQHTKLTTLKVRTKTKTVAIPKTKIVKQRVAQRTQEKEPQNKPSIIKPIKPIPPLQNKQSEY